MTSLPLLIAYYCTSDTYYVVRLNLGLVLSYDVLTSRIILEGTPATFLVVIVRTLCTVLLERRRSIGRTERGTEFKVVTS